MGAPSKSVKTVLWKVAEPHFLSERLPVKTGREPTNTTQNGESSTEASENVKRNTVW